MLQNLIKMVCLVFKMVAGHNFGVCHIYLVISANLIIFLNLYYSKSFVIQHMVKQQFQLTGIFACNLSGDAN